MECRSLLLVLSCFIITITIPMCSSDISNHALLEPYDVLFDTAVEAYYKNDWMSVILNMERALRNKATLRRVRTRCRIGCANRTAFGGAPLAGLLGQEGGDEGEGVPGVLLGIPGAGSVEDLGFFQTILRRADCVNSCELGKLGPTTVHKIGAEVELEFKKRSPYNYLQVAYFKINMLSKAVAAANTFFQANPDHMEMKQNLDYYRMMAGVQEEDFKDLEARPHMAEFLVGKRYYSDDSFGVAAKHFEEAVALYFVEDEECRALCEGAYDYDGYNYMEYSADLFQSMTDHYMQALNCKQRCTTELAMIAGKDKPFEDFLPAHLNYLQFSYYNSEKYAEAIECTKTFLLFHPEDAVMKQNLAYYSMVHGEDKADNISARQVVKQHIQRSLLEKELLYYGYEVFGLTFVDPDAWTPAEVMPLKLREKQKSDRETAARITEEIGNLMKEISTLVEEKNKDSTDLDKDSTDLENDSTDLDKIPTLQEGGPEPMPYDNVVVTMRSQQLNGTDRVLLDGVISEEECRELHGLSNAAALSGGGGPSPHSPNELFQGVTVLKAVKLGQEGKVPLKSARLFFDVSEKVRTVLESHFQMESHLFFAYSHLVCRSAVEENQEERGDLSHPVHVDNCLLISEINECIKEPPAYTHRDYRYSAILYLNQDFEGGDFIFTELDAKTVTAEVRPQCGRVVGFGSGKENPHGVRAVSKGQRCAVALWFTLDPIHQEKERIQADDLLKMFSTPVDEGFLEAEGEESAEAQATPQQQAPPSDQEPKQDQAADEPKDDPTEPKLDPPADATAEQLVEKPKVEKKPTGKATNTKAKAAPKAKAGDKAKAKTAVKAKAKPAAKTDGKQPVKTKAKAKQTNTKDAKPAAKKTVKAAVKKDSKDPKKDVKPSLDSQKDKEEL